MLNLLFIVFCILLSIAIVYPPTEFVSLGLTLENIFSNFLGSEDVTFVQYHVHRTALTIIALTLIPTCVCINSLYESYLQLDSLNQITVGITVVLLSTTFFVIYTLLCQNYENNHIVKKKLRLFATADKTWKDIMNEINTEYRRVEKVCIQLNPYHKVVATENWIIKTTPFTMHFCHQNDAILKAYSSDTHQLSHLRNAQIDEVQFVNIEVSSLRSNVPKFEVRLNVLDFKEFQDRVSTRINILPNVQFHTTLVEKFMEVFKEHVKTNPVYSYEQPLELCIGCLVERANVKLKKHCDSDSESENDRCVECLCRPMWCLQCMASWFASRQDTDKIREWLSMKCTCPLCRSKFCVADVSLIPIIND